MPMGLGNLTPTKICLSVQNVLYIKLTLEVVIQIEYQVLSSYFYLF